MKFLEKGRNTLPRVSFLILLGSLASQSCFSQDSTNTEYSKTKTLEKIKNYIDSGFLTDELNFENGYLCKAFQPNCTCIKDSYEKIILSYGIREEFPGEWHKSNIIVYGSIGLTKFQNNNFTKIHLTTQTFINSEDKDPFTVDSVYKIFGEPTSKRQGYSMYPPVHGTVKSEPADYKNNKNVWLTYTYKTNAIEITWDFLTTNNAGIQEISIDAKGK